jgi:hypothetical protein
VAASMSSIYQKCCQEDIKVKAHLHIMMLNTISEMVLNKR